MKKYLVIGIVDGVHKIAVGVFDSYEEAIGKLNSDGFYQTTDKNYINVYSTPSDFDEAYICAVPYYKSSD